MDLRILLYVPFEPAKDIYIDDKIETIMKLLTGWFSVMGLENQLLLYCLEHPVNEPFNRMVKNRPIFGNFLISKFDQNGARKSLSDKDVDCVINDLLACTDNTTN